MKPFEKYLQEHLDSMQSSMPGQSTHASEARSVNSELREAEAKVLNLQSTLQHALESLNAQLAVEIRKRVPKLSVNLTQHKIEVRYRSKTLICWPNIDRDVWEVELNETGRYFMRSHSADMRVSDDPTELAEFITEFFGNNYKTLQDVNGPMQMQAMPTEAVGETAVGATEDPIDEPQPDDIGAGRPALRKGKQRPGTGYFA